MNDIGVKTGVKTGFLSRNGGDSRPLRQFFSRFSNSENEFLLDKTTSFM
jgi:hypothetical protein